MRRTTPARYGGDIHADDPLAGLDGIDWTSLRHAHGDAADVPDLLRALLDASTAEPAIGELDAALVHQGAWIYDSTARALPFLSALALDPATPARVPLIELIGAVTALLNDPATGGDSAEATAAARSVLAAETGRLLSLLEDQDPAVRLAAGELSAGFTHDADRTATKLIRPRTREKDRRVAVARVLAVGTLGATGALSGPAHAAVLDWLVAAGDRPGDPLRLARLVARRRLAPASVSATALVAALDDRALVPDAYQSGAKSPAALVAWIGDSDLAFAHYLLRPGRRRSTDDGLAQVGAVLGQSRSATAELVPELADLLDEPSTARRAAATHLLAACGEAARPYADRIAASDARTSAVWALARLSDRRAVDTLNDAIRQTRPLYPITREYARGGAYSFAKPGLADVLTPMGPHADHLIEAIRVRLQHEQRAPDLRTLTEVLAAWGPAAGPAVPQLIPLLDTEHAPSACTALIAIGNAAAPAATALASIAGAGGPSAPYAARALFRITGDPAPLLAVLRLASFGATGRTEPERLTDPPRLRALDAWSLADLGPLAAERAGPVAELLSADPAAWPTPAGVESGYAHWRMTGDASLCHDVFDVALEPLVHGRQNAAIRDALRHLSTMEPASVRRYQPLLRAVVDADERLQDHSGWRRIAEDDETRALIKALPGP